MYQVPFNHVSRVADLGCSMPHMLDLQARDFDAGWVDSKLDQAISDWRIYDGFRNSVAGLMPEDRKRMTDDLYTYSRYSDFVGGMTDLNQELLPDERQEVLSVLGSLLERASDIGGLFSKEMATKASQAYGESITSVLFTLLALKKGDSLPDTLPLRGESQVKIGRYSFEDTLETMRTLDTVLGVILEANQSDGQATRVNRTGAYGAYRLGPERNVLAVVRLMKGTSFDPAIEYGTRDGTQASIGYSVEEDQGPISAYKKEQRSPFCIRIDNEGDTVALDIGSIFGPLGSLGKRVADIIAIGDRIRSERIAKDPSLNHNSRGFAYTGFEEPEVFARLAAEVAEKLEHRCAATSQRTLPQLVLKQTVDA